MVMQQKHKNFNDVPLLVHNNHHNQNETNKLTWKGDEKTKSWRKNERTLKNKRKKNSHKKERDHHEESNGIQKEPKP
jgi:hypothetical protein